AAVVSLRRGRLALGLLRWLRSLLLRGLALRDPAGIRVDHLTRRAVHDQVSVLHPERTLAHGLDGGVVVAHHKDGAGTLADLGDALLRTLAEVGVTGAERLVDDEDVGHGRRRDREPETRTHARGVRAHREVD